MDSVERIGAPLITQDTVVFGMLLALLALIFHASTLASCKKLFRVVPALLFCYFLPSLLTTTGLVSPSWIDLTGALEAMRAAGFDIAETVHLGELKTAIARAGVPSSLLAPFVHESQVYYVASRFLLPASLILLTLSIDLKEVIKLGPKALIMFLTGTVGVILGGPLAILIVSTFAPEVVGGAGPEAVWKGMSTVAGSWIGGGANQAAMYEIFKPSTQLYSVMITIDVIVAEVWMVFLLLGVGRADKIDRFFKADSSAVESLKNKMHEFGQRIARIPTLPDLIVILGITFGAVGLSHLVGNGLAGWFRENAPGMSRFSLTSSFFWLIVLATSIGIGLSFTRARNFEGVGASKIGSVFIYILVATIGMKMNVLAILEEPALFGVGAIWMAFHIVLMVVVAKLIRAPFFFLAVGSKANIGGAASAPVVAAAFHPALAPVGVLLAVVGYGLGTYGAWLCALLMKSVSP